MKYFVTGATGFIGSHFAVSASDRNRLFCLVRGGSDAKARVRLLHKLSIAESAYDGAKHANLDCIDVIRGNIKDNWLGVSRENIEMLQAEGIDIFFHFAASLNFEKDRLEKINKHNVQGVKNAIALAARMGVQRFVYVSTAYTVGKKEGLISETLHDLQGPFNNYYEESKCSAEHIVAAQCNELNMAYSILRPSVIIGVSSTKRSGGSTTGLYAFVRDFYQLKDAVDALSVETKIYADPDMSVNFNPIDAVIEDIDYIIDSDFSGGPIYHISATHGVRLYDAVEVMKDVVGIKNLNLIKDKPNQLSPLDELIGKRAEFYNSYLVFPKLFERSIPLQHGCHLDELREYVERYVEELRSDDVGRELIKETLRTSDAVSINTYRTTPSKNKDALLIINAFGMPVDFWYKFISRAKVEFNIYTWESRYLPSNAPLDGTNIENDRHIQDAMEFLNAHGVEDAHVVGWCTGAKLALKMAYQQPHCVKTLTLLSGGFNIPEEKFRTSYEKQLTDTLNDIASDILLAELYYDLIYAKNDETGANDGEIRSVLHATNANYLQYTSLPFRSPQNIYRYANQISTFYREKDIDWANEVDVPTLVLTAKNDINTHPNGSRFISELMPDASYVELGDGDHYLMDSHTEFVLKSITKHIGKVKARTLLGIV